MNQLLLFLVETTGNGQQQTQQRQGQTNQLNMLVFQKSNIVTIPSSASATTTAFNSEEEGEDGDEVYATHVVSVVSPSHDETEWLASCCHHYCGQKLLEDYLLDVFNLLL